MRHILNYAYRAIGWTAALLLWWSCGENLFKSVEKTDTAEDAILDLENDDPDSAIKRLESALVFDPDHVTYLSILSAAYAQRAGIDPLRFATKVAANGGSDGGNFAGLYSVVPAPTPQRLADIDYAISILVNNIPREAYLAGDTFKVGLFQTASLVMHTKALDLNGDGKVSAEEAIQLSGASAGGILSQINSARAILATAGADNPTMQKAAESLASYQAQIDASPGATADEKLRNFISNVTGGADPTGFSTSTGTSGP